MKYKLENYTTGEVWFTDNLKALVKIYYQELRWNRRHGRTCTMDLTESRSGRVINLWACA